MSTTPHRTSTGIEVARVNMRRKDVLMDLIFIALPHYHYLGIEELVRIDIPILYMIYFTLYVFKGEMAGRCPRSPGEIDLL
jgi:hypothetical protein